VTEGDTNVTETNLFVARRTKTRSRPTKKQSFCFIYTCLLPKFPHKVWLDTPSIVISHRIMSGGSSPCSWPKPDICLFRKASRPPLLTHLVSFQQLWLTENILQ